MLAGLPVYLWVFIGGQVLKIHGVETSVLPRLDSDQGGKWLRKD